MLFQALDVLAKPVYSFDYSGCGSFDIHLVEMLKLALRYADSSRTFGLAAFCYLHMIAVSRSNIVESMGRV